MMFLAQMPAAPQLPPLPEGPSLESARGPVEIPLYEPWQIGLFIGLGILAVACVIWFLVALYLHKKRNQKPSSAYQRAHTQLNVATQTKGDDEHFARLCSGALRNYFEDGLHIATRGRTSEEFLRSLKGNTRLDASFNERLEHFLAQCDAIKFARMSSNPEQRTALHSSAVELIQTAEKNKDPEPK
jgi:hypothetical protein